MARQTIKQRIALDGGKDIEAELKALGKVGEEAFKRLQEAAKNLKGVPPSFLASLQNAQKALQGVAKSFTSAGREIQQAGRTMSTFLTLPIAGLGGTVLKVAGDFESAMNEFVANTGAAGDAFDAAKAKAIDLGNASVFSATESAQAMTELAKVGLSYEQIMEGAAEATVKLAAANGAELGPAAAIAGDIINQFGLKAKDLDGIINGVSGTLIQSKLDFEGYRLAIGQAGGTAGALGVELEDFNAVLAATASSFASGSDAGTSFKTFLQKLTPNTKKAVALFEEFNLQFFDAEGNFRGMSAAAEELQTKLGGLSEENLNIVFGELFGTDAIRTAIALMKQGGEGIDAMRAKLAQTDAEKLAETRVRGLNGALDQLRSAFDQLAIAIGDSGLLQFATDLALKLTEFLKELAKADPATLKWGTAIAAAAAAIGPLLIGIGLLTSGIGLGIAAIGRMLGLLSALIVGFGRLRALAISNPWIAAITLVGTGLALWASSTDTATSAMERHRGVVDNVRDAYAKAGNEVAKMTQEVKDRLFVETVNAAKVTGDALESAIGEFREGIIVLREFERFKPFRGVIDDALAGTLSAEEFAAAIASIGATDPALAPAAARLLEISANAEKLSKDAQHSANVLDLLTGKLSDAEFQAREAGGAFGDFGSSGAAEVEKVATAAAKATTEVAELGKQITVTSFGGDGAPVKQVYDLVNGVAQAAKSTKGELESVGESADAAGKKVTAVSEQVFGVVKRLPEELRGQTTPAQAITTGLPEADVALQNTGNVAVTAADAARASAETVGSAWVATGEAARVALAGVPAAIAEITAGIQAAIATQGAVEGAEQLAASLAAPFREAAAEIDRIFAQIKGFAAGGFNAIRTEVGSIAQSIEQMIARILAALRQAAAAAARLKAQASSSGSSSSSAPKLAGGGQIRGPGTPTSDSILAWLSNTEFVMQAKAVRKYGTGFMHAVNNLSLPKDFLKSLRGLRNGGMTSQLKGGMPAFSLGGLVDGFERSMSSLMPQAPRLADGGLALAPAGGSTSGRQIILQMPGGETFDMVADESVAEKLQRFATGKAMRSTGRKPGWR